ncbi:PTS sugar transporter subunit IIB [Salinicoccus sesuvii]|uniref:PTS sugar transporter subunit IIB n=1 Tax=Salinicoccus sesuvii TaxID=868281 RepID=A0ABV7N1P8_9STAP
MKNIMVICETGITTSLLVTKLKELADKEETSMQINSKGTEEGLEYVKENSVDVVLLGPQIHHKTEEYQASTDAEVLKISVNDYNNMNAYSIFEQLKDASS